MRCLILSRDRGIKADMESALPPDSFVRIEQASSLPANTHGIDAIYIQCDKDTPVPIGLRDRFSGFLIANVNMMPSVRRLDVKKTAYAAGVDLVLSVDHHGEVVFVLEAIGRRRQAKAQSKPRDGRQETFASGNLDALLSANEKILLEILKRYSGEVVPWERLLSLWPGATRGGIQVTIARLRKKLSPLNIVIRAITGNGYSLTRSDRSR